MDETHFICMHRQASCQVLSKTRINKSINMMKLMEVVRVRNVPQAEELIPDTIPEKVVEPSTSTVKKVWKKRKAESTRRGKKKTKPAERPISATIVDVISGDRDIGTQTEPDAEKMTKEEAAFQVHALQTSRMLRTKQYIKLEDFDDEYPEY